VVRCRPSGSIAKERSAPQPGRYGRYPRLDGQRGQALSIRKRVPSAVQRRIGHRLSPRFTRVSASRAATSSSSTNDTGMRRSCRCRIRIAYSRLPATSAERPRASASSGIRGTLQRPEGACLVGKWSCPAVGPGQDVAELRWRDLDCRRARTQEPKGASGARSRNHNVYGDVLADLSRALT